MKIAIVDYGVGNRMSVRLAMERLGAETVLTRNASDLQSADAVILPGVGAAGVAIAVLEEAGLMQLLPQLKQPVLGICLGMQLMAGFLWEDEVHGLGIVPAKADFLGKLAAGAAELDPAAAAAASSRFISSANCCASNRSTIDVRSPPALTAFLSVSSEAAGKI